MLCRILLADDHPLVLHGLSSILASEPDLHVAGCFDSGAALLEFLHAAPSPLPADVLLLDLYMPGLDGLTLLPQVRRQWPALRVLVFSSAHSSDLVNQLRAADAHGYLPKSAHPPQLIAAIRTVFAGQTAFPGKRSASLLPQSTDQAGVLLLLQALTPREREIIGLIRQGLTTPAIAERLSRSEYTITVHRRNLMKKLQLPNLATLVRFAAEHGL